MKKRLFSLLLFSAVLLSAINSAAFAAPENSSHAMVLMHADSGQILFSQNADEQMLIASTTKIMTALVVIENCKPEETVDIIPEYTGIEGSSMYLAAGEKYTVEQLLYGLLLTSGNDAAVALACHCGGSVEGFVQMMNEKAQELGLSKTSFQNPNGLDAKGHGSTAEEMAVLTCYAMENPLFAKIVSTKNYTVGDRTFSNHNKLLWNYEGALGVKTGYTMAAGRTLVSCARQNGLKLICVTLNDPNDWRDHCAYFDWGFENYEYKSLLPMGELCTIPVISGEQATVSVGCVSSTETLIKKGAQLAYTMELPKFVYAGVLQGEQAGKIFVTADGQPVGEFSLVYTKSVPLAKGAALSPWERIKRAWFLSNKYGFVFDGRK